MKALIIACYFPPFGGGATVRVHNFVKNLSRFGVKPVVLTLDERHYEAGYSDPGLLASYPETTHIYRTEMFLGERIRNAKSQALKANGNGNASFSLKRTLKRWLIPDEHVFWVAKALPAAMNVVREEKPEVIFATAPPFSAHLLGSMVSARTGIPLVIDYRDLWTQAGLQMRTPVAQDVEKGILGRASCVIVTNEAARNKMVSGFRLPSTRVEVVPNGFDGEEIAAAMGCNRPLPRETLTLSHIGSLTAKRTPEYFFRALKKVMGTMPRPLRTVIVGYAPEQHRQLAERIGVSEGVEFTGPVSRERALELMCNEADVLLLFQRISEGGETAIPGKAYEYLAAGKPVLAMDEGKSATSHFLANLGVRGICEYEDVNAIAETLKAVSTDYEGALAEAQRIAGMVSQYDRLEQTRRLAELLKSISAVSAT